MAGGVGTGRGGRAAGVRAGGGPGAVVLLALLLLAAPGCHRLVEGLRSQAPPPGSESARRLAPGPFEVASRELRLVDASRPTPPHGAYNGSPRRTFDATVWYPADSDSRRPLVVYSHGFSGNRREMLYLLRHLASYGYVVAALDFPLTKGDALGGPTPADLRSQPGDVRFLLDTLLAPDADEPFSHGIDPERVGAAGLSYGGLTTELLAFHPREADPRVKAAVSIAGPTQMLTERFFARGGPPFLMIAGTADALVPYDLNALPLLAKLPGAAVVALDAGTHLGFVELGSRWVRFVHNPDQKACEQIAKRMQRSGDNPQPFDGLAEPDAGIRFADWVLPCRGGVPFDEAMRPRRQHMLTELAVRAFFDSVFSDSPADRAEAAQYLTVVMPDELPDAHYLAH